MKRVNFIGCVLVLLVGMLVDLTANDYFSCLNVDHLNAKFPTKDTAEGIAKEYINDPKVQFELGLFYLFNAYGELTSLKNEKGMSAKNETEKAVQYFKRANEIDPTSSLITAFYGSAIVYSAQWGSPISKMRNGKNGLYYLNLAKTLGPYDTPTLYTRIRSLIYLPGKYYPGVEEGLLEDTQYLIDLLAPNKEKGLSTYDLQVLDSAYFYRAVVCFRQKKPRADVNELLSLISTNSVIMPTVNEWVKKHLE